MTMIILFRSVFNSKLGKKRLEAKAADFHFTAV